MLVKALPTCSGKPWANTRAASAPIYTDIPPLPTQDSYDVSIYGEGRGQGLDAGALAQLGKHNPNVAEYVAAHPEVLRTERMSGGFPYFKGLEGAAQRWVPFNGGIGAKQLQWLRQELRGEWTSPHAPQRLIQRGAGF